MVLGGQREEGAYSREGTVHVSLCSIFWGRYCMDTVDLLSILGMLKLLRS